MLNAQQPANDDQPLRSQRLTEDETRAVIALWQQEQVESGGLTTRPSVPDMAEGLGIGTDDVQRLLSQIREKKAAEETRLAEEQRAAELEQIRLAEQERQAAERDRQEAEWQRRQAAQAPWQSSKHAVQRQVIMESATNAGSGAVLFWFIVIVLLLTLAPMVIINSHTKHNAYLEHVPGEVTCMIRDPSGKDVPCSPEIEQMMRGEMNDRQPHR